MMSDREVAEKQITDLLNRALRSVPFVKLDSVDEVTKLFQYAVDLMEQNLDVSDDESTASVSEDEGSHDEGENDEQSQRKYHEPHLTQQATLVQLAAKNDSSSGGAGETFVPRALPNKLLGLQVTRDYSSPSLGGRSLSGAMPKRGVSTERAPVPQEVNSGPSAQRQLGLGGGKLNKGHSSRAQVSSTVILDDKLSESDSSEIGGRSQTAVPKNKFLAKVGGGAASNREFPSPKLGPRSLGNSPAPQTAAPIPVLPVSSAAVPSSRATSGGARPVPEDDGAVSAAAAAAAEDVDVEVIEAEAPEDMDDPDDLIKYDPKKDPLNKFKDEIQLPVKGSPKQFTSNLHLLALAKQTMSTAESDRDLTGEQKTNEPTHISGGSSSLAASSALLAAAASGVSDSSNNTPKPAYLRRLDSPLSHHGQLMNAKARLQLLINRGIQTVPNVKSSALPSIKQAIEAALSKLEASCITPAVSPAQPGR